MRLPLWSVCLALTAAPAWTQPCPWIDGKVADLRDRSYWTHSMEARPGERLVIRGEFPHARAMTFTVRASDGNVVDTLIDTDLLEIRGWNPFLPGMDRRKPYLGEYEIEVRPTAPPSGKRPANVLYTGSLGIFRLAYEAFRLDTTLPGGKPPRLTYFDSANRAYCQDGTARTVTAFHNGSLQEVPSVAANPPQWSGDSSEGGVFTRSMEFDARFGAILEVKIPGFRAPVETDRGEPFPEAYDVRYWSLAIDPAPPVSRVVADFQIPPSRRLILGLGGARRPAVVPGEEWIGLTTRTGTLRVVWVLPQLADPTGWMPHIDYLNSDGVGRTP